MDLEGGWTGLAVALGTELEEECGNRPRVCYALLRREGAEASPGCRMPGVRGRSPPGATAGVVRSAVNLALGMHGLGEAFTLTCVMDEEACSKVGNKCGDGESKALLFNIYIYSHLYHFTCIDLCWWTTHATL